MILVHLDPLITASMIFTPGVPCQQTVPMHVPVFPILPSILLSSKTFYYCDL